MCENSNHRSSAWHPVLPGAKRAFPADVAIYSVTYLTDAQTVSKPEAPLHVLHV